MVEVMASPVAVSVTSPAAPDNVTVWVTVLADVLVDVGSEASVELPARILVMQVSWLVTEVEKLEAGAALTAPIASTAKRPS